MGDHPYRRWGSRRQTAPLVDREDVGPRSPASGSDRSGADCWRVECARQRGPSVNPEPAPGSESRSRFATNAPTITVAATKDPRWVRSLESRAGRRASVAATRSRRCCRRCRRRAARLPAPPPWAAEPRRWVRQRSCPSRTDHANQGQRAPAALGAPAQDALSPNLKATMRLRRRPGNLQWTCTWQASLSTDFTQLG